MKQGVCFSIAGLTLLLALAGCGRGFLQYGERESWRRESEIACLKSGEVKLGADVVQIEPIDGPGICGADFPLKVTALGEGSPLVGYADDLRPPSAIPNASAQMPHWPINETRYAPRETQPNLPIQGRSMHWVTGPSGIQSPQTIAPSPAMRQIPTQPMSINPPGIAPRNDIPDDAILERAPNERRAQPAYNAPVNRSPSQQPYAPPALGPARDTVTTATATLVSLNPPATLACPIVSALDRWIGEGVQPAALHWFGTPVVKIQQISAYSCRGMVGSGTSTISEHAFGNALDIAGFMLADGRSITVKDGWHGTPEEQGFLHDVQLYACETFTTVLAPGYNIYHYNHIHVDLMRRASGSRPCRPEAVRGEIIAAKARAHYANQRRSPAYTGSIRTRGLAQLPQAVAGEDGYVDETKLNATKNSLR